MQDGTVSTFKGCFTVVRDFTDVCIHSYFSILTDLRKQGPPNGKYYEIRFADFIVYNSVQDLSVFQNKTICQVKTQRCSM